MKAHVLSTNSHLAHTACSCLPDDQLEQQSGIPCEGTIFMKQAFIGYAGAQERYRPYLHLCGEVRSVRGQFPCNVTEVTFGESRLCPKVEYHYEFSNEELADLCKKGLFEKGFACPDIFFDNEFELPMTCSCTALKQELEDDVPILFIGVEDAYNLSTSSALSGYSIANYFEEVKQQQDEFLTMDEPEYAELSHTEDIFEATEEETLEEPEVETEEVNELSDDEKLLQKAFDNIQNRVQDKITQDVMKQENKKNLAEKSDTDESADMSAEESEVSSEMEDAKAKNVAKQQQVVRENQTANEETVRRDIPSNIQDIADKDSDVEYMSEAEFDDSLS